MTFDWQLWGLRPSFSLVQRKGPKETADLDSFTEVQRSARRPVLGPLGFGSTTYIENREEARVRDDLEGQDFGGAALLHGSAASGGGGQTS